MSDFEAWVKYLKDHGSILYKLEEKGSVALYKTWEEYESRNTVFRTSPVFHLWIGEDCRNWKTFMDYREVFANFCKFSKNST